MFLHLNEETCIKGCAGYVDSVTSFWTKWILKILWDDPGNLDMNWIFDIRNYKYYRCNNDTVIMFLKFASLIS